MMLRFIISIIRGIFVGAKFDRDYRLSSNEILDDEVVSEQAWREYEAGFAGQRKRYPHDQINYDHADFVAAMTDNRLLKMVFHFREQPIAFAIVAKPGHADLAQWVAPTSFGNPSDVGYLTVLYVYRSAASIGNGRRFVRYIVRELGTKYPNKVFGFDIASGKKMLARMIQLEAFFQGYIMRYIGSQDYYRIQS
ncbi:MAG: hypothetical protein ABIG66_03235 [Candidatus Kerfeldbacteria bacterium]